MKHKLLKLITILLLFISMKEVSTSQVAISYEPFQNLIGISSNMENLFWVDFKFETNSFLSNLNIELSTKYNYIIKENINYYTGIGLVMNPTNGFNDLPLTNGYFVDFGVRIKPLKEDRNAQLFFEISPYINQEFSGGYLRSRLGISYNFN